MGSTESTQCGYIAMVGRPNAGKSTLLNAIIGQKLAGVSVKPQTTRHPIVGIKMLDNCQMLFVDTPGMHRQAQQKPLNSLLNKEAWSAVAGADVVLYLVDVTVGWQSWDQQFFGQLLKTGDKPVIIVVSKCDKIKKSAVRDIYQKIIEQATVVADEADCQSWQSLCLSAKDKQTLPPLLLAIKESLPQGGYLFDSEQLSDKDNRFFVKEFIQEQLFRSFGQEIPYQCTVIVESFEVTKTCLLIGAKIVVARQTQKGMMIGKNGSKIKEIGTAARHQMEDLWQKQVNLELRVSVTASWYESMDKTRELCGFEI